jgi:hypothetical protein
MKQKILFIYEMKWDEILLNWKTKKTIIKYRELLFEFWIKFDQLLTSFHGMNES